MPGRINLKIKPYGRKPGTSKSKPPPPKPKPVPKPAPKPRPKVKPKPKPKPRTPEIIVPITNPKHPFLIVTGTGRSGTSFTSYVIHKCLGICMAKHSGSMKNIESPEYKDPVELLKWAGVRNRKHRWPGGSWEHSRMSSVSWKILNKTATPAQWLTVFNDIHPPKRCQGKLVGCKTPVLTWAPMDFWTEVKPKLVINCTRVKHRVLKSMSRYAPNLEWCEEKFESYLKARDGVLRRLPAYIEYVELDFSEERHPSYVIETLKPILEELYVQL
jgi:hypothetical protein